MGKIQFAKPSLILSRIIFYLFQGFIIGLCYFIIPSNKVFYDLSKIIFIGIFATFILISLDTIVPEIGILIRYGTGILVSSISNF